MVLAMATQAFGFALRKQRDELSFSVAELASAASVLSERLEAIENGAPPTTREIGKIASALAVDPAALWRGDVVPARTTARFRAPAGVASLTAADARLLARGAEAGRIAAHLNSILGRPPAKTVSARRVAGIDGWPEPWEQGYKLGAQARFKLYLPKQPIKSMEHLLEDLGVHVAWGSFETTDIHAASLYEPGAAPVIILNRLASRTRAKLSRRAVLAHELCHLLHDGGETDVLTLVSRANDVSPNEQRANGFAPCFIAPGGWIIPHTTDPRQLALDVGTTWGLSFEGAAWHLKNAKYINNREAEDLIAQPQNISDTAFESPPTRRTPAEFGWDVEVSPLVNGLLSDLALTAYGQDLISCARAIEILRF
jgi:Zn-dependent peptidase ImmA (M78 family)